MVAAFLDELAGLLEALAPADESIDAPALPFGGPASPGSAGLVDHADAFAAIELVADQAPVALAAWLAQTAHLIVRGGARALVCEAQWAACASGGALATELGRWAAARTARWQGPRLIPVATTRRLERGPVRTFETGLRLIGDAQITADGERVIAFGYGALSGALARQFGALDGSLLLVMSLRTGAIEHVANAGQFREDDGALALSPDGRRAAVRSHRSTQIVDLTAPPFDARWPTVADQAQRGGIARTRRARVVHTLASAEGPADLVFLDDRRLLVLDSSTLELWDGEAGARLHAVDTAGFSAFALAPDRATLAVAGGGPWAAFAIHAVPSLDEVARITGDRGRAPAAIAFHPDGTQLAVGDWDHRVRLWRVDGTEVRNLGAHRGWVSAVQFVDGGRRLVSTGWDGQLIAWDVATGARLATRAAHTGYATAIAVHPDGDRFATCAEAGELHLWRGATLDGDDAAPFAFAYGSHGVPITAGCRDGHAVFAVADQVLAWQFTGAPLGPVSAKPSLRSRDVRIHDRFAIRGEVEGERPTLRLVDGRAGLVDELPLRASILAIAASDDRLATLDNDGHVTFWRVTPP